MIVKYDFTKNGKMEELIMVENVSISFEGMQNDGEYFVSCDYQDEINEYSYGNYCNLTHFLNDLFGVLLQNAFSTANLDNVNITTFCIAENNGEMVWEWDFDEWIGYTEEEMIDDILMWVKHEDEK